MDSKKWIEVELELINADVELEHIEVEAGFYNCSEAVGPRSLDWRVAN